MASSRWMERLRSGDPSQAEEMELSGRGLLLARLGWWGIALVVLPVFLASLPAAFAHLQMLCDACDGPQLTAAQARQFQAVGISLPLYAAVFLGLNGVFFTTYMGVAVVLFWRKAGNRMAILSSLFLLTFGGATFPGTLDALATQGVVWGMLVALARFLGTIFLSLFVYLFPNGRFVPSWMRVVAIGGIVAQVPDTFLPGSALSYSHLPPLLVFGLFLGFLACPVGGQIYRYRRVSKARQRQQTKWVIFGLTIGLMGFVVLLLVLAVVEQTQHADAFTQLVSISASYLFLLLIPFSLGMAILRHRLWEIDLVIRRSLVYGILTLSLALVYGGLIMISQTLLGRLIGPTNDIALVVSTLVVAVLFQPLRRRIQHIIDRHFYRSKYEANRVLETFSASLRSEVDLEQLSQRLLRVVQETMQPAHSSLWLRSPELLRTLPGDTAAPSPEDKSREEHFHTLPSQKNLYMQR